MPPAISLPGPKAAARNPQPTPPQPPQTPRSLSPVPARSHWAGLDTTSVADAVAPLVETYFLLWSERRPEPERADLLLRLRQALGVFRGMAAAFPICRPRVLLWHGHYALRMGHARLGEWFLSQALASAQRYRMPFDEGLAHLAQSELARRQGASARAQDAWQRACALLNRVEAYYYLTRRPAEMTGGASI